MKYSPQDFESLLARRGRAAEEKRTKGATSSAAEYEALKKRNKAKPVLSKANEIGGLVGDVLKGKEEEVQQEAYNKYLEVKPQRIENINNAFFSDMGNLSAPSKSPIPLFETAESIVKNRTGRLNYDKWYQDKYGETKEEHGLPDMALEGIYWREAQDAYYGSLFGAETIDAIKGSLRKAYPNIDTEGVDIDGERYSIDEMTEAAYPHVAGTVHSLMMDASDEYRKYNFWKSTGKSYRSYMKDTLSEIEKEIKALQKEAGDAAYADTKAREMERLMSGSGDIVVPHWSAIGAEKAAEARYEDALDHIASMRENDFASGFADAFSLKSALSLGISDVMGGIETNTILKKMQNGEKLYGEEKRIARLLQLEAQAQNIAQEIYGAPSWTNELGSFLGGTAEILPQFLTGNALMGGVGKTAQVVTKEGINQAVRGGLKSTLKYAGGAGKRMLSNIPTHLMRGYAAAPGMPMTYADYLKQRNSQYQVNPDGSVTFTPKSAAKAYLSSLNNTAAEFASEGFGGDLGEVLGLGAKGAGKMLGIDKLTTRNAATVAMTKLSNPTVKDSFKKFMRMSGYQGWGEAPGEIAGDLYANAANALIGAEHSFEQFKDIDYWTTNFVGSFLFGGGMHAMAAPSIYADAKVATRLADKRDQTLSKIESKELRDNLKTIGVMDNSLDAATALASLDWGKYRPEDKAYALDYVRTNYDLQMHMGIAEASEEMTRFEPRIAEVMGRVHLNDDGSSTGLIYNVVDKTTGKAYYATRGDVTQEDAMLELIDAETGEKTTKIASTIEPVSYHRVDEVIAEEFVNMFSLKNNISRIEEVGDAYESLEDATDEDVASLMDVMSINVPEVGDTIALIDGRHGVVEEVLGGGKYMITTVDAIGDMTSEVVPFTTILSSDAVIANAQKVKVQSEVNRDIDVATTAEVETSTAPTDGIVEGAIVTTPNGEQARVVEITDDGNVVVDYNLENVGVADMTFGQFTLEELQGNTQGAEASPTSEAEIVEAAENVESIVADNTKAQEIPRNEDGTVNYEAIEDTTLAAEVFSADYDSPYDAADAISSTIEDINSEIDYLSSKGKGKKRKKTLSLGERKKQDAQARDLTAKKARYSAMLDAINAKIKEVREQEAQQNAEKSKDRSRHPEAGLERNAFTETLSSEMVAAIDAMAKKMGVKVRFTDKKITGNAHYRGNEIVIAQEARDKSILALLGHEVLHHMREYNPNAYEAFKASVREFIGAEQFDAMAKARQAMYARQRVYITAEVAAEEICADMAGEMVMRLDVFEEYLEQNSKKKGLLQSLHNALVYILDFFTGISGFDANYAPKLQSMVDTLNTLINATVEGKDIEKREETSAETTKNEETTAEEAKGEEGKTKTKHSLKAQPSLVGVHNISLDKLRKVIKMGGLANPSVAVIDVDKQTHDDYGEYSLILPKNMVDARQGKNAGTWAGDAWTPTYPQIVKRMNDDKAYSRFHKDIEALPEAMRNRVRLDFDSFMDGRDVGSLAYWYLYEKGVNPALVAVPSRYSDEVINALSEATNGTFNLYNLTPEALAKCLEVYIKAEHNGDKAAYETKIQERKERLMEKDEVKVPDRVRKWAQDKVDELNEYGFDYSEVSDFVRDVETDMRNKGTVNVEATIRAAKEQIENGNLIADYNIWLESLDERYGIKEYIFNGYTNNGDRKYLPHTVENASKWMKKQGRNGAVATFPSFGVFIANAIPKMTTLESIRKRKDMLGKSNEAFEAFKDKWLEVYHELGNKLQPDAKGFDDYGYWRLIEAVGKNNPKEFIKKEYGIELSEEDMAKFNDMVNAIRTEYPARYFETKFERPLQLSDFVAAVVPNDMPMDVYGRFKDANVEMFEYEKGNNNSRAEAMQKASEMENVRFSLMDDAQAAAEIVPYLEAYNNDLTTFNALVNKVKDVAEKYPNATWPERFLKENYEDENEDDFINRLKWTISNYAIEEENDYSEEKQTIEETFGGIWVENTEEFAKFVSAVNKSPFEEDGEGIAYTDNYFYAYYRNINGEPVPYASFYMNEEVSQDIVKKVIKELNDVRTSGRVKERIDSALERIRDVQSQDNANDGDNSGASSRRRNERLGFDILRKGRYFDNPSLYVKTSRTDGRGDVDYHYSLRETDPEVLEQLNNGNTIKVYRAMQVIDGELYPPMSARVGGKLRAPIALGEWERAEERPDLADNKGYFKLDKGNSTSLKARYNPYIHTSLTPLNDQFSSAQDRPNLVTVEVEIPESELTSGYKADKAKDAVGKLEWKAGVVQSQLTGTRTVILSRWDRPIRIVPDSEVAQRIVEMFGDTKVIMPSNVVTPSLREELEKLGVPFRETDNQGKSRYSLITPEMDASYLEAVERGDMATAQKMVMEAAKLAMPNTKVVDEDGNPKVVYHGTPNYFNAFSKEMFGTSTDRGIWGNGFYFSEDGGYAKQYQKRNGADGRTLSLFLSLKNPLFISLKDGGNEGAMYFHRLNEKYFTDDIFEDAAKVDENMKKAQQQLSDNLIADGYDGVVIEYSHPTIAQEYVAFEPNQIKSADPVTYDDAGNVIPLSERFNPEKEDIRYSLRSMDEGMAILRNKATEYNIDIPFILVENASEYVTMMQEMGMKNAEKKARAFATYIAKERLICFNGSHFLDADADFIENAILHEYTHHATTQAWDEVIALVATMNRDDILWVRDNMLTEHYNDIPAAATINEIISTFVEEMDAKMRTAAFKGEIEISKIVESVREEIANDAEIDDKGKGVLIATLPLVAKALEFIKEKYNGERETAFVLRRDAKDRANGNRMGEESETKSQEPTMAMRDGDGRDREYSQSDRNARKIGTVDTRYSLSDIPFFEDEGEVVIFNEGDAPLSENVVYVAPKTTEERMMELLESQHLARIKTIRKEADDTIAMARKRYAEERVRGADDINNTRSFSAKLDMLFGDMPRETLPLHDQALALIAAGDVKIRWDDDGTKKGLASEMGYKHGEKKNYKQITSKATQSFEGYVHTWWESINGYERGIDVQDMRNALIEALSEASTQSRAFNILREVYDVARKERDTIIDEAHARRDYAIQQEDARYAEECERFDKDPDKASFIRHYEMTRAMDENLDAMTELVSRLDTTIASLRRRVDRAEGKRRADREKDVKKRKQMLSDVYASIEDSKMAIQDTIRRMGAMRYNSNELKWIMNNVHTARSAKDIEVIAERVRNIALTILIREQRTRMNKALNLRLGNGQMLESWLYGLQKDGIISAAEAKRVMNDMWRGTNAKGVAVAKYVDDHTRQVMEKLRAEVMKSAKRSMVDTGAVDSEGKAIKEYGEDKELAMNIEAARNDVNERIMVFNRSDESTWSDSDKATYSMLFLYMKYLDVIEGKQEVVKARKGMNDTFSKTEDGGVEGAAAREDIPEKRSALVKAKTTYMDALMSFNEDLESVITKGREGYKTFRENEERHRRDIINLGLNAIGQSKRKSGERLTAKERINLIAGRGFFNIPYYTFETALREIDHLSPNGQGEFFHHFMDAADAAVGVYASSMLRHVVAIGSKVNNIWGYKNKDVASALLNIQKKANDVVVATFHFKEVMDNDGNMLPARVQEVNIANGMYLLAMWGQDRYRRGMKKRGITQEQIDALRGSIEATEDGAKYLQFMEWVRDTFLVDTRDEYDTMHVKMFGTHMDAEKNYFPAKILNYKRDDDFDFDSGKVGELYVTGIIKRTSTAAFINPAVDYFSMLIDHVANMDHWTAYAELHRDLKYLLNSEAFKERLNNYMGGRKGKNEKRDGEGSLYKIFWDTSAVMLDRYKLKATRADEMIMRMTKGWATANIAGRLSTALKQFASSPLFAVYAFDPRCGREWLRALSNPRAAVKWAMENSAAMRARVDRGDMGNEFLSRKIGGSDVFINEDSKIEAFWKATDELLGKATKVGMAPNVYVDMWSSCIGLKAIYEFEIRRMTEDGKKPITDVIRKKALLRAERAVNETQQSSEGAYLSTIQKQRGVIMSAIATYQNQPYAMHRKRVSGAQELWRQAFDKEYNEALARRVENITDPAERKRELARIRREARRVAYAELAQGILGDFLFQLFGAGMGAICVACAGVDDDEIGLDMLKDALLGAAISIGVGGFFLGGLAVSIISGFTKRIGEVPDNLMPAVSGLFRDMEKVANAIKDEEYKVSLYEAVNIISTYRYGIDGETLINMMRGVDGIIEESGNTEAVMHILNMPKSQIRLIAGRRREGETVKEYITRVARVETLGMNDIIDNLIDEEGTLNASALSNSIGGISKKRLEEIAKKADEELTKDVTNAYLSGGYEAYLRIEDAYKEKVEAIGWTENKNPNNKAYESGEYVTPIAGLSEDEYNSLENIAYEIARYAKERERFMGTEEGYFEYLESEIEAKQQFNEKYNEYIK